MRNNLKEANQAPRSNANESKQTESSHKRLSYALVAAKLGIPVVPLKRGTNEGVYRWPMLATTDGLTITRWIVETYPDCNFGLVMGRGWICLDLDRHEAGKDGIAKLNSLHPGNLETLSVSTPNGGKHYYFRTPDKDYRRYIEGGDGIDVLGSGGYAVSPFSTLEDGRTYLPYGDWNRVTDIPQQLTEALPGRFNEVGTRIAPRAARTTTAEPANHATRYVVSDEPLSEPERIQLQRKLGNMNPDLPYDPWYKVVFAVLNVWKPKKETINLLAEWSSQSYKWDAKVFDEKIRSYYPDIEKQLGLAFLARTAIAYPMPRPVRSLTIDPEFQEAVALVADRHCAATIELLQSYGSTPSDDHRKALAVVSKGMAKALFTCKNLRIAFPLETGMGKTTAVIALCKTISDLGINKSLLITCERIEQLAELRDSLLACGIPRGKIGLVHRSQDYRADVPANRIEDARNFRFLLASHQRIKLDSLRGSYPARLMEFNNGKRDLVVWDESLIGSQGHSVGRNEMLHSISLWLVSYEIALADKRADDQFWYSYEAMRSFLETAKASILSAKDEIIYIPPVGLSKDRSVQALGNIIGERMPEQEAHLQRLTKVIEYAARGHVRIVQLQGDHALLQFEQTIDPVFNKVVILDASCPIRHLAQYDPTLEIQPVPVTKRYTNVEIRWVSAKASRNSFKHAEYGESHFRSYIEHLRTGMHERYDHAWEGLIFCYKDEHKEKYREKVEKALQRIRDETGWGVTPIHVLHWGQHRASNRYKDARWTFFFGVQYLPRAAIAAAVIGQVGRLDYRFLDREIDDLQESEIAESIYQAISRGNSRNVQDGEAGAQLVDLVLPEREMRNVWPLLEQAMPGVKITKVDAPYFAPAIRANAYSHLELAERIAEYLKGVPETMGSISKRAVNKVLGVAGNDSVYRRAVECLPELLASWRISKRSYVRIS